MSKAGVKPSAKSEAIVDFNLDDVEVTLGDLEAELTEINAKSDKLQRGYNELVEYKLVLQKFFKAAQNIAATQQSEASSQQAAEESLETPLLKDQVLNNLTHQDVSASTNLINRMTSLWEYTEGSSRSEVDNINAKRASYSKKSTSECSANSLRHKVGCMNPGIGSLSPHLAGIDLIFLVESEHQVMKFHERSVHLCYTLFGATMEHSDHLIFFTARVGPGFKGSVQKWDLLKIASSLGYDGHEEANMLDFSSLGSEILSSTSDGSLYTCMHHLETVNWLVAGTGNGSLRFININQGQKLYLWRSAPVETSFPSLISSICTCGTTKMRANEGAASPSWIAAGLSSGHFRLLDMRNGNIITSWQAHEGYVTKLAAPEDHLLVSSSLDKTLREFGITVNPIQRSQ
ncbi:protein GFS12 isoform X1 [Tanacetum coccineum]